MSLYLIVIIINNNDDECLPLSKDIKNKTPGCKDKECHSIDGPSCYNGEKDAFGNNKNIYFSAIVSIANVIWGIYTENGEQKKLIYNSNNDKTKKTVKAFGVTLNELVNAFSTTAKALARSSKSTTNISFGKGVNNNNPKPTSSKPKATSANKKLLTSRDRCGPNVAVCAKGLCCSKYGWCDKTKDHCGSGCQPKYGMCY
ncbi:carbohydrate-binding module family 18 protein [Piromyces sp. E2]|nr:carbohydrate-binding module family 18 protein [Piromyces sp. E2]|eukprot:OUM58721.1 carbohydrate-binding module family 18 protein [Piromyces sp. E2]